MNDAVAYIGSGLKFHSVRIPVTDEILILDRIVVLLVNYRVCRDVKTVYTREHTL